MWRIRHMYRITGALARQRRGDMSLALLVALAAYQA